MPLIIPNTTLQDSYADATTFAGNDVFVGGFFTIANNPAAVQLAVGALGAAHWQPELYLPPATYPILGGSRGLPVSGIRARNFVAGSNVQFFGGLFYPNEPGIQAGTPYDSTVAPGGGVTPVGSVSIAYQATPPATPADGDLWIYSAQGWLFRYDSGSAIWIAVGAGIPLASAYSPAVNSAAGSNVWDNATLAAQVSVTVPFAGSYLVQIGGEPGGNAAAAFTDLGWSLNGADPVNSEMRWTRANYTQYGGLYIPSWLNTASFAAADTISLSIRDSNSARRIAWAQTWLGILPNYVS